MIEKMTKYSWILLSGDKQDFLDSLRESGVVDITRSAKPVDATSEEMLAEIEKTERLVRDIETGSDSTLAGLQSEADDISALCDSLRPWGDYDKARLDSLGLDIRYYSVPVKRYDPVWELQYPIQIISRDESTIWFITLERTDIPIKELPAPVMTMKDAERLLNDKLTEINKYKAGLSDRRSELPQLKSRLVELRSGLSLYLAGLKGQYGADRELIIFEGFAPSECDSELKEKFDGMPCIFLSSPASAEDNPPIKLRNNRFVQMFEVLTDMYGRPRYDGFDPTVYISIFFMLFFAMCMGDMGYGIVLVIVGTLLRKSKGFANLAPLVRVLGAATIVVGFLFHNFFSIDISTWKCIPDFLKSFMLPSKIAGYDTTMILALAVGIVHLLLAMMVKTFNSTRNKGFLESLSVWGWTIFWTGLTAIGLTALAGVIDKDVTRICIIILGIVCAIGIFPLNDIHRNPLANVGSGLWDTYNMATGILGDVLSYLRLYALGLAGSMLGFAFNELAKRTLGDSVLSWIPFILIVVIGHSLNLAMAGLGAFVHPLRLNFLEFFKNSGYEGSGIKYNPLK